MTNEEALQQVRSSANGVERNPEEEAKYPIKERYEMQIPNGEETVHVYVCEPLSRAGKNDPLIINMHGGGFVKGYRGRDYIFTAFLANLTECLVVDVDYIPAPDKKYPYSINQGYAVVKYFYDHAEDFGVDPAKIILSGQSAGANMITVISMINKYKKDFQIRQLILAFPPLDLVTDPLSKPNNDNPRSREISIRGRMYNEWYANKEERETSHVSPILATPEELRGLPPFLIMSCGLDSLGPEAEEFALHLIQAGVTVTAKRLEHSNHGFLTRLNEEIDLAKELILDVINNVR